MCAIAGILNLKASPATIDAMQQTMRRRGPDDLGVFQGEDVTLLHARLAIIDIEGGRQPMTLWLEGEEYTIVYNGELYNTEELRIELINRGHCFRGHSDTEVLLHGYAQWGRAVLEKLNGIFAFAVWEKKAKRLFLARDRIGVKPLFYAEHEGGLLFASEIKTILKYPDFRAAIDVTGAAELLLIGPGRTPGCGIFRGVREIEPGCCAFWEKNKLTVRRYWKLTDGTHNESFEETAEHVRWLVEDSIRRQMVSDVPIGCFLSGGLDSSLICAVVADAMKEQGRRLDTFSVDYDKNREFFVPGKFQPNSDADYLGPMEEFLGAKAHRVVLTSEQLNGALEEATEARDLPGMADVDFSLLLLCREIRKNVTVALSGECADEIFGGYPWYRDPEVRARAGFPWAQNTGKRRELLTGKLACLTDARDYVMSRYAKTLLESDIDPDAPPVEKRTKQMVNLNFRWFMQTLLDRKDRMSMHSSLEVRVPFCDYRIAEYLYRVPWEMKDHGGCEKGLLRRAMAGWLPEQILWRKKSPYPKTYDPRYLALMRKRLDTLLEDKHAPIWQLIRSERAFRLADEDMDWPWYGQLMKTPQTIAYFCQIDHWLRHYNVDILI
ncbi:MAG: asparagine synthase (glutamine-hydrolyzing) [Ruminococcaceae bacterium]|nr:asparagine synthase (glutamine-hydrolyzing) [Oscillospiraceae bacterium]